MPTLNSFNVNQEGHLTIGGCDTIEIANKFSTPLYVMHEEKIRENCRLYKEAFLKYYDGKGLPIYASKAFNCLEICRIINDEGLGLDVVSEGELYTALKSGFPPERIHFHGNNKTLTELEMAVKNKVGRIVVDNLYELELLNSVAKENNTTCDISLRIKPGIDAHTHKFIKTGQIDSKFGFSIENNEAFSAVKEAINSSNLNLKELHCHIGSQIFDVEPFKLAAEVMMNFINLINQKLNFNILELNLGGGFGIKYIDIDNPTPYEEYIKAVSSIIKSKSLEYNIPIPFIYIEPGRSIVGEAGITLYKVGAIKEIPNVRTYISIDGSMADNPRYALYQSKYKAVIANKASKKANKIVTIAGKCCESGDLIQENTPIQDSEVGDIMAVFSTGAYNYSMSSNYNRLPKPAVVMIKDSKPRIIIRRQTMEDIIQNDI